MEQRIGSASRCIAKGVVIHEADASFTDHDDGREADLGDMAEVIVGRCWELYGLYSIDQSWSPGTATMARRILECGFIHYRLSGFQGLFYFSDTLRSLPVENIKVH